VHHISLKYNYGHFTMYFDRLFDTYRRCRRLRAAKRPVLSALARSPLTFSKIRRSGLEETPASKKE
jgi:sterol desaturase/sphingolipid hydroxylase (fatty acid hydroxylase superfamily)